MSGLQTRGFRCVGSPQLVHRFKKEKEQEQEQEEEGFHWIGTESTNKPLVIEIGKALQKETSIDLAAVGFEPGNLTPGLRIPLGRGEDLTATILGENQCPQTRVGSPAKARQGAKNPISPIRMPSTGSGKNSN